MLSEINSGWQQTRGPNPSKEEKEEAIYDH
jgi:hypothetical protein